MWPLEFWKKCSNHLPGLAKIAKNIKVFKPALLLANVCLAQQKISSPKTQKNVSTTIYYFSFFET